MRPYTRFDYNSGHAAVNYNQRGRLNNPAWYPAAITMPTPSGVRTRAEYLEMLPTIGNAKYQVRYLTFLGHTNVASLRIDRMPLTLFSDVRIRGTVASFLTDLTQNVEKAMVDRNALHGPEEQYGYMKPSLTPRSILT